MTTPLLTSLLGTADQLLAALRAAGPVAVERVGVELGRRDVLSAAERIVMTAVESAREETR